MTNPSTQHPAARGFATVAAAEFAGTFVLVFGLIGAATLSAPDSNGVTAQPGIGLLGVAVALGLSVMIGAFAFGRVSGGHFNPAVSLAAVLARRIAWPALPVYVVSQCLGGFAGASAIFGLVSAGRTAQHAVAGGFASNGFDRL